MKTSDFYFDLPEELIAQEPLADRASSRLMVVHKDSGKREHRHFRDIKEYLRAGDCLVINNTKVLPAVMNENSKAGQAYRNIVQRLLGNDVPLMSFEPEPETFMDKLKKLFRK